MENKDKYLIIVGIIFCIALAVLSPLIASPDPDGLEKSAEDSGVGEMDEIFSAPFPDYSFEPMGIAGDMLVLLGGGILTLLVAIGLAEVVKKRT